MKRFILGLLLTLACSLAHAQDALVVQTCGTLPQTYAVGSSQKPTVDVNGRSCLSSSVNLGQSYSLANYLTPAQLTTAQSGVNTNDVSSAITNWLAACPTNGCVLIVPPGYFYSATCNFTIANPFLMWGAGPESIGGVSGGYGSLFACGSTSAKHFNATAITGTFQALGFRQVGGTATSGSSAVLVTSGVATQKINFGNVSVDGYYDGLDIAVGSSWFVDRVAVFNSAHYGVRIRNIVSADAGDWRLTNSWIYPVNAVAGISYESSGGGLIANTKIVPNSGTVTNGLIVNVSASTQLQVIGNDFEGMSEEPIKIVNGFQGIVIANNYLRNTIGGGTGSDIVATNAPAMMIMGNDFVGGGTYAITLTNSAGTLIGPNKSGSPNTVNVISGSYQDYWNAPDQWTSLTIQGSGPIKTTVAGSTLTGADLAAKKLYLNQGTGGQSILTMNALGSDYMAFVVNGTDGIDVVSSVAGSTTDKVAAHWGTTGGWLIGAGNPVMAQGELAGQKITASGSAPGAGFCKESWVAGTSGGTCKKIAYCGTSTTPTTIIDNVGSGC